MVEVLFKVQNREGFSQNTKQKTTISYSALRLFPPHQELLMNETKTILLPTIHFFYIYILSHVTTMQHNTIPSRYHSILIMNVGILKPYLYDLCVRRLPFTHNGMNRYCHTTKHLGGTQATQCYVGKANRTMGSYAAPRSCPSQAAPTMPL